MNKQVIGWNGTAGTPSYNGPTGTLPGTIHTLCNTHTMYIDCKVT